MQCWQDFISLSLSLPVFLSPPLTVLLSLSSCFSLSPSHCASLSLFLAFSLPLFLFLSLSVFLCLSLSSCFALLSLCLSLSNSYPTISLGRSHFPLFFCNSDLVLRFSSALPPSFSDPNLTSINLPLIMTRNYNS